MNQEMTFTPFLMVFWREIRRFMRVFFQTVIAPIINASLYLLIFGVSLGQSITAPGGMSYLSFLIPGLVMMSTLNNAFQNASGCIVSAKFTGELEDWRSAPLSRWQVVWGLACGAVVRGLAVGLVAYMVGVSFQYYMEGTVLIPKHPGALIAFLLVGSLIFGHIGIWLSLWAKSFDQLTGIGSFILLPLLYLGGVFFSLENLHPVWQGISKVNPVLYLINGVRYGILGYTDVNVAWAALVAVLSLIVMHLLAYIALARGSFQRW